MPQYFQKPEAALKRAEELIQVSKESDALDVLHDTIKSRRHKQWTPVHEQIMTMHLELCVSLKKPHVAKDALFQYKTLTQSASVRSLEVVIEHFLKLAEEKTEDAQKTSIEKVEEIDDLDQGDIPETLLLSVVSGAAAQDRMDRTVLAPWLRFLWDSYRNCLELLRNNAQVEQLYHRIARQSFQFCSKYQRRTEFRKLCELLRLHLNQIQKHQHLQHVVKLTSADSLTLMQDTRLHQLDTAIQMELWQEAYRSAEDVHGMMQLSKDKEKRMVKPASYVNYYDKLALVFWKAGNSLFHAAALLQKYTIYKDMKKSFTAEEAQEQASRVLLATLSIHDGADAPSDLTRHLDIEDQHSANIRLLSNLLRLPIAPTRAGILKEAARLAIPEVACEPVRNLHKLLENNFAPLRLATEVEKILTSIDRPDHMQYVEALRGVVATKALKQISVIYDSISWTRIQKIIPFYNELELERLLVDISKHRFVRAQIDHRSSCVRFGATDATLAGGVDLEDADGFTGDDTQLGVEGVRAHLELMYNKLRATVEVLDGEKRKADMIARVKQHVINYERNRQQELERIIQRRRKIENYKEINERVKAERTQLAQAEMLKREEAKRAEEMKRLEQENIESEKKRRQAEQEEIQRKVKQEQLRRMQHTAIYQAIVKEKGEQVFQNMDPEMVLREQRERLDRERMETQKRLQQQEKTFDHHIRAIHLEEMVERKAIMNKRLTEAPKLHDEYEKKRVEKAIADHAASVKMWQCLQAVREDCFDWIEEVKESNRDDFQRKKDEFKNKLDAVRADRLADRAEIRKKERRDKWIRTKAEEKIREEQKRLAEKTIPRYDDRERNRRVDDSIALSDSNWRSGGGPIGGRIPDRERQPMRQMREPNYMPPSRADESSSWRSEMKPTGPPPPRVPLRDDGPSGRSDWRDGPRSDLRDRDRDGPRSDYARDRDRDRLPPVAPSSGAWTRGQTVKREEAAPSPARGGPSPLASDGPKKYVPPSLRERTDGGRGGFDRDRRGPPPPSNLRGNTGSGSGGADSDNWRRK